MSATFVLNRDGSMYLGILTGPLKATGAAEATYDIDHECDNGVESAIDCKKVQMRSSQQESHCHLLCRYRISHLLPILNSTKVRWTICWPVSRIIYSICDPRAYWQPWRLAWFYSRLSDLRFASILCNCILNDSAVHLALTNAWQPSVPQIHVSGPDCWVNTDSSR